MPVDGQHVPLPARKAEVGDSATGTTVALTLRFGPLRLLRRGKDASDVGGMRMTVFKQEAVTVTVTASSPTRA